MKFAYVVPLIAVALFSRAATSAQAATISHTAVLPTIAKASLGGTRDLGHAANTRVDFSVVLPYRNASDLSYLLAQQNKPGSKYYRRFLTSVEFRSYFSPTVATYAAKALALRQAGFSVETFANRTVLHASGSSTAAEKLFHTAIDIVQQSNGRTGYANVAPATMPAALSDTHVVGLNNLIVAHTAASQRVATIHSNVVGGPLFGPDGGFGPLAIAKSGDFPIEHGYRGTNSNVADLIDGPVGDTDVATFLKTFSLKRSGPRTTTINVDGGCGVECSDGFVATLDAEWILALAPGATLFTYEMPELTNGGIVDAFNAVTSDDAVNIVNFAVSACEVSGADLQLAIQPIIAQGAAEGITFETVAFGGANFCNVPPLVLPGTPSNLDTVTAVGGSNAFTDNSGKLLEQSALSSSNGGVSIVVPEPAWEAPIAGASASGRNVPDVVIPGEVDGTGPSIYYEGSWVGGATFVNNAPFAGYLATVQEMYGYATPIGNVAPAIWGVLQEDGYKKGATSYYSDVSLGCIGAVGGVPVCAKKGYDVATGIGSVSGGYALAKAFSFAALQPPTP